MKKSLPVLITIICTLLVLPGLTQRDEFTRADTLRGALRPERTCFDVHYYVLELEVFHEKKKIEGRVDMHFHLLENHPVIQVDLFDNMRMDSIVMEGVRLDFYREANAIFVQLPHELQPGAHEISMYYGGVPIQGKMLPWDGGVMWTTNKAGAPWIGVACEGTGASLWWPNKDHLSDEPDSVLIRCTVQEPLQCIANGSFLGSKLVDGDKKQWEWKVSYPINNYNVTLNIGDYAHFSDTFACGNGIQLPLDYYVMPYNLVKAKEHFKQVPDVLRAFEFYLGPYPFPEDGYALVETPYLGMEHQGAIAYGNRYQRGYLGGMQPSDMDQDYIIVHETAHEYFGNWISCSDHAEMWIHESFATYMESLFVEYYMGKEDALRYLRYQKSSIRNNTPLVGPLGVNFQNWGSSDIYYKGAWVLQTLRAGLNDDEAWFKMLRAMMTKFGNQVIHSGQIVDFVTENTKYPWGGFFDHYLYKAELPVLKWRKLSDDLIALKWESEVDAFNLPLHWIAGDQNISVFPVTQEWVVMDSRNWNGDVERYLNDAYLIKIKESRK
jgi:aminopeptidase N